MTECQLGLHQETVTTRDGRPTIICTKCGRTIHTTCTVLPYPERSAT